MQSFGWGGCVGLSAMPLPLHPLVLLGMLTGMSRWGCCTPRFLLGLSSLPGVSDWSHGTYRLSSVEPCFDCKIAWW
jgi:hypothetical protein